jgi:hypothetical protein
MEYFKDFDRWNNIKKAINAETYITKIRAGEIRWIALGVNIGSFMYPSDQDCFFKKNSFSERQDFQAEVTNSER